MWEVHKPGQFPLQCDKDMNTVAYAIIGAVLLLAGFLGVFLPVLPGVPLAWLGLLIYAVGTGFERVSQLTIIVFGGLAALTVVLDLLAPVLGSQRYKASFAGILGTFLGFIFGALLLGFWGAIFGPILGAFLGEVLAGRRPGQAAGPALGAFVGFCVGTLIKSVLVLVMAGFFVASLF